MPDATGAGLHQHRLTLADAGSLAQGLPRGDRHQRRGRRLDERQPSRFVRQETLVDNLDLLIGPGRRPETAVAEEDLVAGTHPRHGLPDALHDPGAVPPEDRRKRSADRATGAQLVIDRVDPGGPQPHPNVMLSRDLGLRQVREVENLGSADSCHQHRAHHARG